MPVTIHKVLLHGAVVISSALLPIGQMSEEAQESRNKHLKQYREHHSRKISRESTNQDVFNRLLVTSGPFITSLRNQFRIKNKRKSLPAEVIDLLSSESDEAQTTLSELHQKDSDVDSDSE